MKPTIFFIALAGIVFSYSCKKDKTNSQSGNNGSNNSNSTSTSSAYTSLKAGNYWIYQDYKLDSVNGEAHALGTYDSVYVEKDTSINGNTYHKYVDVEYGGPGHVFSYFRDSSGYMVDQTGRIFFSADDFSSVFKSYTFGPNAATPDTLQVTEQMGFKDMTTVVDGGSFTTSPFRRIFHFPVGYAWGSSREYDYRYAKNVGLVSYTLAFYTAAPEVFERRLVRYHVQ